MNDLIRKRMECKIARDFDRADLIERDLRTAGVSLNDGSREWTITGSRTAEETGLRTWSFSAVQRIDDAREKLQELVLDYMDFIGDPGAKGRLFYEVASSCTGPHCPEESTSYAVGWRGPNGGFLSLVELPFVLHDGIRSFHAHMILQTQNNQHMKRLGCSIKVYGDDYGVPLKYCDPYALVSGGSWQDVDEAVEIVRDAIKTHMRVCSCTYSLQPQLLPPPHSPPAVAINMKLPAWIQRDSRSRQDLFCKTISCSSFLCSSTYVGVGICYSSALIMSSFLSCSPPHWV
jgi:hypothetical protein